MPQVHYRTCSLCEAMCGLRIEHDGQRVLSIRGDEDDPLSGGYICPKAAGLQDIHEDPDRLRKPLRRKGNDWEEISWDEALTETAQRIHQIQEKHGNSSFGMYVGNPNVHNLGTVMFAPMLFRALRTKNRYSATSVDQLPHMLASHLMFGHHLLFAVPDIDRTQHMVIMGGNPLASNGSLMSAPGVKKRLEAIQERGGQVIVIDPRRTETAQLANAHHFITPGTDALFLLSFIDEIFRIGPRLGEFEGRTKGVRELKEIATRFSASRTAKVTGINAATVKKMAQEFMNAPSAAFYGRIGAHTQEFGGLAAWLIHAINLLSGNLNRPGGTMFPTPAVDGRNPGGGLGLGAGTFRRWKSRVRGLAEFGGELPVAALAEEILTPGDGQIKGMFIAAGNPVLSTPNGQQVDRALGSLDFLVCVDIYLNETSRHAHIILPPCSPLERPHYDLALQMVAVRNTAKFSEALFKAPDGQMEDGMVILALLERLERLRHGRLSKRWLQAKAMQAAGIERVLDLGLRTGPYGYKARGLQALTLKELKSNPHGVDLGPLVPAPSDLLPFGRDQIDLAPKEFVADLERLEARYPAGHSASSELILIGRRQLRSNNSWMHNVPRLMRGKDRCTLMMHPQDAQRLGLSDGGKVRIESRVGSISAPLEVTEDLMPGVVSLPHGFGHNKKGTRLKTAESKPGVSVNDLTDELLLDTLSGNAALSGVAVKVSAQVAEQAAE